MNDKIIICNDPCQPISEIVHIMNGDSIGERGDGVIQSLVCTFNNL